MLDRDARPTLEALPVQPLLQEAPPAGAVGRLAPELRTELDRLATSTDSLTDRSERLWQALRKHIGQPEVCDLLMGVTVLSRAGEPTGARLLAALLDVHAPGAEMVTHIHRFDSSRRLCAISGHANGRASVPSAWLNRLAEVDNTCRRRADELSGGLPAEVPGPRNVQPFPLLRRWLEHLLAMLARHGDLDEADTHLLISLARLEVDAYEERVSRMASTVNPYLASAVTRVLPRLSQADSEIRAMREFISGLESGRAGVAFRRRLPRLHEAFSPDEREALMRGLEGKPGLAELPGLLRGLARNPIPIRRLAGAAARLMALASLLRKRGLRQTDLDLLTAVVTVQRFERDGEMRLPVGADLLATLAELLALRTPQLLRRSGHWAGTSGPDPDAVSPALTVSEGPLALPLGDAEAAAVLLGGGVTAPPALTPAAAGAGSEQAYGPALWPLDGFRLEEDALVLRVPQEGRTDRIWRDDLPVVVPADAEAVAEEELDASALKRLVLANLDNTSVTIGFLRNPKVVAIPGLIAGIVMRSRSVRILEVIANDRTLYTGFSNKDVPRSLLLSPCNIPVRSLTKFVHVKYVNKLDLQRMSKDKTGVRRDVLKEIQSYLNTLGS